LEDFLKNQVNWKGETKIQELEIEDLPKISIPKGIVPLKRIFDRHDMYKGKKVIDQSEEYFEINIGSTYTPRMVKLGNNTTHDEGRDIKKIDP
jgi:hypothetical protein